MTILKKQIFASIFSFFAFLNAVADEVGINSFRRCMAKQALENKTYSTRNQDSSVKAFNACGGVNVLVLAAGNKETYNAAVLESALYFQYVLAKKECIVSASCNRQVLDATKQMFLETLGANDQMADLMVMRILAGLPPR